MSLHFDDGNEEENRPLVAGKHAFREPEDIRTGAPTVRISVDSAGHTFDHLHNSKEQSGVLRSLTNALTAISRTVHDAVTTASEMFTEATTSTHHHTTDTNRNSMAEQGIELHSESSAYRMSFYTSDDGYTNIDEFEMNEDEEDRPPTAEELFWGFCRNGDSHGLSIFLNDYCTQQTSFSFRSSRDALVDLFVSQDERRFPNEMSRVCSRFNTGIHYACEYGHLSVIDFLHKKYQNCIEWNALRNKHESTPLHIASAFGHSEIVQYLLDECLRPPVLDSDDIVSGSDETDYFDNSHVEKEDIVGNHVSHDSNNEYTCIVSKQPSMVSASSTLSNSSYVSNSSSDSRDAQIIHSKRKSPVIVFNAIRNTPLHCAVYGGHIETVKILLRACDDPLRELHRPNAVRVTPLQYSEIPSIEEFIRKFELEEFNFESQLVALRKKHQR